MNEEDERDENGMPTPDAVRSMAAQVHLSYEDFHAARAAGDFQEMERHADRVREEMGGLLCAIREALGGDDPHGAELDGPTPRTRIGARYGCHE